MKRNFSVEKPWGGVCYLLLSLILYLPLTGCGSSNNFALPYRNLLLPDTNPIPYARVRQGGTLRLPISLFPANFNDNQANGASGDLGILDDATGFFSFRTKADGSLYYDPADFTDIKETLVHGKQTLIYTINPQAHWSNGLPITERDFAAEVKALNGKDPRYLTVGSLGYDQIESVRAGKNNRQVIVTMKKPLGEWQGLLFSPLLPASVNETPDKFNNSLINHTPPTAGPFTYDFIDPITKVVVLKRDPHWWGRPAKLDTIRFTEVADAGIEPYIAHEFDAVLVQGNVNSIIRTEKVPHTEFRRAVTNQIDQLTFNEAADRITHDIHVRRAIAMALDREFMFYAFNMAIAPKNFPLINNHFFLLGQKAYQDNSDGFHYDPIAARKELADDGWKLGSNGVRYKNGRSLTVFYVEQSQVSPRGHMYDQLIQQYLKDVGIRMIIRAVPNDDYFPNYIETGDFDIVIFDWGSTVPQVSNNKNIFYLDFHCVKSSPRYSPTGCNPGQNYGLMGNAEINAKFDHIMTVSNDHLRNMEANEIDKLLWQNMGQLPLDQPILNYAVNSRLANYGPQEMPDATDWTKVGWMK